MGGIDFEKVFDYIEGKYGIYGVPFDQVETEVLYFCPNATPYVGPQGYDFQDYAFMWYPNSDTTGHAVNAYWYWSESETMMYVDDQNGGVGFVSKDSIQLIIYPDK